MGAWFFRREHSATELRKLAREENGRTCQRMLLIANLPLPCPASCMDNNTPTRRLEPCFAAFGERFFFALAVWGHAERAPARTLTGPGLIITFL